MEKINKIEMINIANFGVIPRNYLKEHVQKKFFEFEIFLFFLVSLKSFNFLFNFESSVRFSFDRVYRLNFIFQLVLIEAF